MKALQTMPLTKDLPPQQHEQICKIMSKEEFPADKEVIKQGMNGDKFFVLIKGHCIVKKDGKQVNECKPGTGFGDLALLYN